MDPVIKGYTTAPFLLERIQKQIEVICVSRSQIRTIGERSSDQKKHKKDPCHYHFVSSSRYWFHNKKGENVPSYAFDMCTYVIHIQEKVNLR